MENLDTTMVAVLDRFEGSEELANLSQRLMDWDEGPIADDEIAAALGEGLVDAFRYAQSKLAGRVRRVTLEPALCHSADVAIRAKSLDYSDGLIRACLLHDVAEDTSSTISELPEALDDIAANFSRELADNVSVLTNRYQLLFAALAPKVDRNIHPSQRALDAFRAALDVFRFESDPSLVIHFETEFERVGAFLGSNIDLSAAQEVARRDRRFSTAKFLERQLYPLYVDDVVSHAARMVPMTRGNPPVPLVVKCVDIIDNVRTSEVSNRMALNKLVQKGETIIDTVQRRFLEPVPAEWAIRSTISPLHRAVQVRLVDQMKLRRRAVADNFSETRFASLVTFLSSEANRLTAKYDIPKNRVDVTEALEHEIRRINNEDHR